MLNYEIGMRIEAPCYIKDMSSDVYHSHRDSISNSGLKLVSRSPAHYKYAPNRESTRSMVLGSALHMAVLEPLVFEELYRLTNIPDRRCKEYKDLATAYGGEYVLTGEESAKVIGIKESLYANPHIRELLELPGHTELSGFATDPLMDVMCRHRFDKLTDCGIGIDLKTTIDARAGAFSRSIQAYGYHMQAAFYADQHEWITGKPLEDFIFIVVESESPYACKMYRLDQESIEIGRHEYTLALEDYHAAKFNNQWSAYDSNHIEEISLPQWAINQHDQNQIEQFVFMEEE